MSDDSNQGGQKAVLMTFTNNKEEQNLAAMQALLKMIYHVVLTNKLAVMEALNEETNTTEVVLVGMEQVGDSINCYPLLRPLTDIDAAKYASPDGNGGWVGRTLEDTAE